MYTHLCKILAKPNKFTMLAMLTMAAWGYGRRKQEGETLRVMRKVELRHLFINVNGGSSLTGTKVLKLTQIYLVSTGNLLYACIIFQWSFLLLLIGIKSRAPHLLGEHWAASAFFSLLLLRQGHTK